MKNQTRWIPKTKKPIDFIFDKLQAHWQLQNPTFRDLENELNRLCKPLMNFVKGVEVEGYKIKMLKATMIVNYSIMIFLMLINFIFYSKTLLDFITVGKTKFSFLDFHPSFKKFLNHSRFLSPHFHV